MITFTKISQSHGTQDHVAIELTSTGVGEYTGSLVNLGSTVWEKDNHLQDTYTHGAGTMVLPLG